MKTYVGSTDECATDVYQLDRTFTWKCGVMLQMIFEKQCLATDQNATVQWHDDMADATFVVVTGGVPIATAFVRLLAEDNTMYVTQICSATPDGGYWLIHHLQELSKNALFRGKGRVLVNPPNAQWLAGPLNTFAYNTRRGLAVWPPNKSSVPEVPYSVGRYVLR